MEREFDGRPDLTQNRDHGDLGVTRILGIDPGSRVTGFGVVEIVGGKARYVASGCIRVASKPFPERLREIFDGIVEIIGSYAPEEMVIEQVFVKINVSSALKLGQARGAAICAGATRNLPVHEYSATQIKQAVVGKGHAAKEQVQHMVCALLSLPARPQADAADALAVALCHLQTRTLAQKIRAVESVRRRL